MARRKKTSKSGKPQPKNRTLARAQVPDVYKEMLADLVSSANQVNDEGRIIKRRRVAGQIIMQGRGDALADSSDHGSSASNAPEQVDFIRNGGSPTQQTAYKESESSAESDLDWEEVHLKEGPVKDYSSTQLDNQTGELNLVLNEDSSGPQGQGRIRRVPVTAAERQLRLETHKMHLIGLLVHIHLRNHWCNGEEVHGATKRLLSSRTNSYLNPNDKQSQFQRSRSFIDGLRQSVDAFRQSFKITSRGMSRSMWAKSPEALAHIHIPRDLELPMQKSDFRAAANELEGSRDVGAQMFCALLRSAGVETRLVCSLQPLPFNVTTNPATFHTREPVLPVSPADGDNPANDDESDDNDTRSRLDSIPKPIRPVGPRSRVISGIQTRMSQTLQGGTTASRNISPAKINIKRIKESPYPVFWVEAFNGADQKWIPVDPLATGSVSKPSSLEPPASDTQNNLTYVLAFESDGSARDVTRRYAKAFNAKTRRGRLEVVQGGEMWWRRVMRIYARTYDLPRDQIEDSELVAREAAEPMPKNVLDFKNHPYYALERHLRRSEVIHPKREVGKVATGRSGGNQILEPIFRRRDVHMVKSGDSWYRLGREVKIGEQPRKYVSARKGKESIENNDETEGEGNVGTALYTFDQTKQYFAPPVVGDRIPKNVFGNLDIYVPSMVPAGGVHIPHPDTSRAARVLGIDYADAVTGFAFRGRHGTAILTGAVVAESCRDAIEEVISAFETEMEQEEEARRILEALRMWKKFFVGLRIRERIQGYEIEGERNAGSEITRDEEEDAYDDNGGGFVPDREVTTHSKPNSADHSGQSPSTYDEDGGGGFLLSDTENGDDGAPLDEHEIGGSHKDDFRNDDQDQEARFIADEDSNFDDSRMIGAGERKPKSSKIRSLPQRADQYKLFMDENSESTFQEPHSQAFETNNLHAPIKRSQLRHETARQTPKIPKPYGRSFHDETHSITDNGYLSQTMKSTNPNNPPSSSNPYLLDAEMAEALALQQIHDRESQGLPPTQMNQQETYVEESDVAPSTTRQQRSVSSSSPLTALPAFPARTSSPPPQENREAVNPDSRSPLEQGPHKVESERPTDDDQSEDADSLLSRDPSDEDADPGWLDF